MSSGRWFQMNANEKFNNYKPSGLLATCYEWLSSAIVAVVVVAILLSCFLRIVNVNGDSMKNTLQNRDRLVLSNFLYEPEYGDIVVIVRENDTPLIKRVIGLAGDCIRIDEKSGVVYRNGEPLDEPYVLGGFTSQRGMTQEITVPEGTLFAMGDNRSDSLDSRMLGPLPLENLVGRVLFRLAPNPGLITDGE